MRGPTAIPSGAPASTAAATQAAIEPRRPPGVPGFHSLEPRSLALMGDECEDSSWERDARPRNLASAGEPGQARRSAARAPPRSPRGTGARHAALGDRKGEEEGAPLARRALDPDPAAVPLDDGLADHEAEPGAAGLAR